MQIRYIINWKKPCKLIYTYIIYQLPQGTKRKNVYNYKVT
jgi:hypothetical protein